MNYGNRDLDREGRQLVVISSGTSPGRCRAEEPTCCRLARRPIGSWLEEKLAENSSLTTDYVPAPSIVRELVPSGKLLE